MTTLLDREASEGFMPVEFSPEGDRILLTRSVGDGPDSLWDIRSIWSIGIDGSEPRLIVDGASWGDWQAVPAGS